MASSANSSLEIVHPQQTQSRALLFAPNNMQELMKMSDLLATSDLVPKQYKGKPADIVVAAMYGAELGLPLLQALNSVCVINGRPGLFGDGFLGVILAQPDCEDVEEQDLPDIAKAQQATCTVRRKGRKPVTRTFTLAMAVTAGLTLKDGPWKTYPARQLQMRARGFAGRDAYADVFRGIKIDAELDDYPLAPDLSSIASTESSATQAKPAPDLPITQDQAREFGKAWKAAGRTIDQAKAFLKETIGVDSSLKIPTSKFETVMGWANPPKQEEQKPAAAATEPNRDRDICLELFRILGYDDVKQAAAIKEHASDWAKLATALNRELPTDN